MPSFVNAVVGSREAVVAGALARDEDGGASETVAVNISATARSYRIIDASSARAAANLPRGSKVALAISGTDPDIAARDQSRINALLNECGCGLSSAFLVACVSAAIAVDLLYWPAFRESPVSLIAGELLLAFTASGIGRFIAIAMARKTLHVVLSSIAERIDAEQQRSASWAV
jgi:hypothetical protein